MHISDKTLLTTIVLLVLVAILSTAYIFLIRKDYEFIVEAPCDPALNTCFFRDCSGGECPDNGLEQYRIFSVSAVDFPLCTDNSCLQECEQGVISCTELLCGETEGDECTGPSTLNGQ